MSTWSKNVHALKGKPRLKITDRFLVGDDSVGVNSSGKRGEGVGYRMETPTGEQERG